MKLKLENLRSALNDHFNSQMASFDDLVNSESQSLPKDTDVWDNMPTIDSKAVARAAAIFTSILGVPFTAKAIAKGGYKSVDDIMNRFVPNLIKISNKNLKKAG